MSLAAAGIGLSLAAPAVPRVSPPAAAIRLPGFAAELIERPLPFGPHAWPTVSEADAWAAIRHASPGDRQQARWGYARSLVARGRGADALGLLDVMAADDPDLVLVPAWQRARGIALLDAGRPEAAVAALDQPMLARDPETCLWRMRALAAMPDAAAQALRQIDCALPALNARDEAARRPFLRAAVRAGLAAGRAAEALPWLAVLPDGDPEANLLRGKAFLALGRAQEGRLRLARVGLTGTPEQRADARLTTIEQGILSGALTRTAARRQLEALRFSWRGDEIEQRATQWSLRLAEDAQDPAGTLAAGAALLRYFDLGTEAAPLAARMQAQLAAVLADRSTMPLTDAAGLFWDYRDLAPSGVAGVRLVEQLAGRLQAAGLYERAGDLLHYRLETAAQDVEQGPLSIRVASLRILSGDPIAAIRVLRATDAIPYPPDMTAERRRVEAVALELSGRRAEAIAVLDDVPDGAAAQAEIRWRAQDWAGIVGAGDARLPPSGALNPIGQAVVLRHAIALAMLGRDDALARLGARYRAAFASLPTAPTFALLTGEPGTIDTGALAKAMAALPSVSPAGDFADLLDQGAAAMATPARDGGVQRR